MARGRDQIDLVCEEWARQRRQLLGLREPALASEYLGAVRSTLGGKRGVSARSVGRVDQFFPEVYPRGDATVVNVAFHRMAPSLQEIMDVHYAIERPRDKKLRAELMGISRNVYWDRVSRAKCFVDGALSIVESVRT